jgi:ABC-type multidrug transport system fused ATPase/permease subunit
VALIDAGTVAAVGTHHELMRTNELYRALLSQEYGERREEEQITA